MEINKFDIEEFKDRYLNEHEEFCFIYKDMRIEYVCEGTCYPIVIEYDDGKIEQYEFLSPAEALEKMKFNGKNIEEIWDELQ